jgi:hypothetical protein
MKIIYEINLSLIILNCFIILFFRELPKDDEDEDPATRRRKKKM